MTEKFLPPKSNASPFGENYICGHGNPLSRHCEECATEAAIKRTAMTIDEFRISLRGLLNKAVAAGLHVDDLIEAGEAELHPKFEFEID